MVCWGRWFARNARRASFRRPRLRFRQATEVADVAKDGHWIGQVRVWGEAVGGTLGRDVYRISVSQRQVMGDLRQQSAESGRVVELTGFEPVTPCLQNKYEALADLLIGMEEDAIVQSIDLLRITLR